jgi:hypothetical protein
MNNKESVINNFKEKNNTKQEGHFTRRYDSGGIVWGLLLILGGLLFLLNNLGIVPWTIWNYIIGFWPIFLIFAGINMIFGYNIFSKILIGLLALISFGLILTYGLYQVGSPLISNLPPQILDVIIFMGGLR